jgi:hypothetical protein
MGIMRRKAAGKGRFILFAMRVIHLILSIKRLNFWIIGLIRENW